jgi:hypothetical protein
VYGDKTGFHQEYAHQSLLHAGLPASFDYAFMKCTQHRVIFDTIREFESPISDGTDLIRISHSVA